MEILIFIFLIILCCFLIWRASDGFETASSYLGRNLSDGVRGATINAIGSSMPELVTTFFFFFYYVYCNNSLISASDGFAGGIGTTAGSAIFNAMIIPAVVIFAVIGFGLAKNINVSKKVILRDGISLILAEICLIILISGERLYWWHGVILMIIYGIYILYMLYTMNKKEQNGDDDEKNIFENTSDNRNTILNLITINLAPVFIKRHINNQNAWFLLLFSMFIICIACFFLVYGCDQIAERIGVAPYFIAVILASAATSVPDTIISYRDALDEEYDDAVANALGSNIFDICFALGFPLFVFTLIYGPLQMTPVTIENVTELRVLLLIFTIIAFFVYYIGIGMGRVKAIILLLIYFLFASYIYAKALDMKWSIYVGEFLRGLIP